MSQKRHPEYDRSENDTGERKKSRIGSSDVTVSASELQEDDASLCTRCASVDAVTLFNYLEKGGYSQQIMPLGTLDSAASKSCQGCQLFSSVSSISAHESSPKSQFLYAHPAPPSEICGRNGRLLVVASEDSEDDLDYHLETFGAISSTGPTGPSKFVKAQCVRHDGINFELLRDWISSCTQHHEKCRRYAAESSEPRGIKLIDCETRHVIQAQSQKYVALSYVWGLAALDPGYDDRVKDGRMPDVLLKTIEDAILATMKLGYRYLWIDRYCIDQDNEEEKAGQIIQMNPIYRHAEVTLIALAGEDPRYGLPGVSTIPRTHQPRAQIRGTQLASVLARPELAIEQSKWGERGWTYQEGYFSIRRLFFGEDQVMFSCYNCAAVETISHLREDMVPYAAEDKDDGDQDAHMILTHLTEYSGKQLTYDSDALNAVAGVFNDYGFKHGVVAHYLGVPIVRYSLFDLYNTGGQRRRTTEAFLVGVSWMNREPGSRRNIWPSWTWAEWVVRFDYGLPRQNEKNEDCFTLGTDFVVKPRVCIERQNGTSLDLQDKFALDTISSSPADLSHFILIDSWTIALEICPTRRENLATPEVHQVEVPIQENNIEYRAILKDEDVNFETRFWPMHQKFGNPGASNNLTPQTAQEEIVGIMLSKLNLENDQYCLILMVVQNQGANFERIGHCSIMSHELRDLANRCGFVEEEWVFGWKKYHKTTARLCAKYMRKRVLRIG